MRILLVSATSFEIKPTLRAIGAPEALITCGVDPHFRQISDLLSVLVTGIGQMQAAFHVGVTLAKEKYDLVLNCGLAGSFTETIALKETVLVEKERLADLGAEDGEGFQDITEMSLLDPNVHPFEDGWIFGTVPQLSLLSNLRSVSSVTVNRVIGSERSLSYCQKAFASEIVNMEGAAVFYAAKLSNTDCIQIRTISDYVRPYRDKTSWDIPGAVHALNENLPELLSILANS